MSPCIRRGHQECNVSGLVSVAVHYTDSDGLPAVWVGATWCDCPRGQNGASRQAVAGENGAEDHPRGLTASEHRHAWEQTGRMTDYLIGPESWQKVAKGQPGSAPPSRETLAKAAEVAKLGKVPRYDPIDRSDWE